MDYKAEYEALVEAVGGAGKFSTFYPSLQFIRVDFLKREDWPNGIAENSVYLTFKVDFDGKVEVHSCGDIYLTDEDSKKSYLAMGSIKKYVVAYGSKWMRAFKYKNVAEAAKKINAFVAGVKDVLNWATDGYPYNKAVQNIY